MSTTKSEDEEDYDELPPISVNSSGRDLSLFSMPCAAAVAAERARERRCEAELARLREEHPVRDTQATQAGSAAPSDSSGSEGEAALAGAVSALQVRSARAAPPPRLAALLPAAARRLPPRAAPFLRAYARAAAGRGPACADSLARQTLSRLEGWLPRAGCGADEACACAAWLCLARAAAERGALGAVGARAAHRVLEVAPRAAAAPLLAALRAALPEPRARLDLADALRGGGPRAASLADRLVRAALADLLGDLEEGAGAAAARWRRLPAPAQHTALQLAARGACGGRGGGDALLAALAAAPPRAHDHSADKLKVLVAASKLQVLFPAKK